MGHGQQHPEGEVTGEGVQEQEEEEGSLGAGAAKRRPPREGTGQLGMLWARLSRGRRDDRGDGDAQGQRASGRRGDLEGSGTGLGARWHGAPGAAAPVVSGTSAACAPGG